MSCCPASCASTLLTLSHSQGDLQFNSPRPNNPLITVSQRLHAQIDNFQEFCNDHTIVPFPTYTLVSEPLHVQEIKCETEWMGSTVTTEKMSSGRRTSLELGVVATVAAEGFVAAIGAGGGFLRPVCCKGQADRMRGRETFRTRYSERLITWRQPSLLVNLTYPPQDVPSSPRETVWLAKNQKTQPRQSNLYIRPNHDLMRCDECSR